MPLLALALLIVALLLTRAFGPDLVAFRRFRDMAAEPERLGYYRWVLRDLVLIYGGLSLVALLATLSPRAIHHPTPEGAIPGTLIAAWPDVDALLAAAQAWGPMPFLRGADGAVGPWILIGLAALIILVLLVPIIAIAVRTSDAAQLAALQPILPRTNAELRYGAGTSLAAGIFEEMLFRLGLPAILFGITGSPWLAFLLACVVFGLVHAYQGWGGAVTAGVTGLAFTVLYVSTGSILLCILVHALIDLRGMVLIPMLLRRTTANPSATR